MSNKNLEPGDMFYLDDIGWHIVLISKESHPSGIWWNTFILEESCFNIYYELDLMNALWEKVA